MLTKPRVTTYREVHSSAKLTYSKLKKQFKHLEIVHPGSKDYQTILYNPKKQNILFLF